MRLLLFSDLHMNARAARALVEMAGQADVLVGAGDFATMHQGLRRTLEILRQSPLPAILVPGNAETTAELQDACAGWQQAHVLHGSGVTLNRVSFFGIGGGIPVTPFGPWSHDFSEEEAAGLLANCPTHGVLVSHSPPYACLDQDGGGRNLGSRALRAAVENRSLDLVVCGHIHHSAGRRARLGSTPVVNAGPAGLLWNLEDASPLEEAEP